MKTNYDDMEEVLGMLLDSLENRCEQLTAEIKQLKSNRTELAAKNLAKVRGLREEIKHLTDEVARILGA